MSKQKAIICDLDGTLCDHRHRLHFVVGTRRENLKIKDGCFIVVEGNEIAYSPKDLELFKPDYEAFYAAMDKDGVNEWCRHLLWGMKRTFREDCDEVIFVTGRPEKYRKMTQEWLNKADRLFWGNKLFMRPDFLNYNLPREKKLNCGPIDRDFRPSHEVKREIYMQHIKDKYDVLFCLEDDQKCADMYRELGLTVLRVMQ